jgi:hypothetical protein
MPCRINRKRKVIGQLLLEALYVGRNSSFLTLTYNPEHYPKDGSLRPDDMVRYLARLRQPQALGPIRYFYVGEYGDKTQRPHYHMAIFGRPPEEIETTARELWRDNEGSLGFVHAGYITDQSISYIAGYTTKKMGKNDGRLQGRYPEFNRRSKSPPLGKEGVDAILDSLRTRSGAAALAKSGDVPTTFRYSGRTYPISDYWRTYMRQEIGIPEGAKPSAWEVDLPAFLSELEHASQKAYQLSISAQNRRRTL